MPVQRKSRIMASSSTSSIQLPNLKSFDGTGFSNWEFRIKLLLERNGVLEVLNEVSAVDARSEEYKKNEVKARSIIVQCLADNVLETVKDKKNAKEIFDTLKNIYTKRGLSVQVELQRKLRAMKFVKGPLSEFLREFEKTVTELRSSGGTIKEDEVISQLLAVMPESYQSVTTAIDVFFSQKPDDIDFQFVKNKLLQEELRQGNITASCNSVSSL